MIFWRDFYTVFFTFYVGNNYVKPHYFFHENDFSPCDFFDFPCFKLLIMDSKKRAKISSYLMEKNIFDIFANCYCHLHEINLN